MTCCDSEQWVAKWHGTCLFLRDSDSEWYVPCQFFWLPISDETNVQDKEIDCFERERDYLLSKKLPQLYVHQDQIWQGRTDVTLKGSVRNLSSGGLVLHCSRNKESQSNLNVTSWILWSVVWLQLASKSVLVIFGVIWRSGTWALRSTRKDVGKKNKGRLAVIWTRSENKFEKVLCS